MPIILPSGVANAKGTPAIISDDVNIASLPASDYAAGTLYIDYDRSVIYSNYQSSSWILIADVGGSGSTPTLQQVLDAGRVAGGANAYIYLYTYSDYTGNLINIQPDSIILNSDANDYQLNIYQNDIGIDRPRIQIREISNGYGGYFDSRSVYLTNADGNGLTCVLTAIGLGFNDYNDERYSSLLPGQLTIFFRNQNKRIIAQVNQDDTPTIQLLDTEEGEQVTIGNYFFEFKDIASNKTQTIYPSNQNYNNQLIFLPEDTGTLALQDPPYYDADVKLSNGSITPSIQKNSIIQVTDGDISNSIILDKSLWKDRVTLTLCVQATPCNITVSGGALLGNGSIVTTGLYYITYLDSTTSFYITN